tara:strand:+ start:1200 stop:1424 length:225 start_codon:yes stop_codon:yes gene_type:complete
MDDDRWKWSPDKNKFMEDMAEVIATLTKKVLDLEKDKIIFTEDSEINDKTMWVIKKEYFARGSKHIILKKAEDD